MPSRELEWAKQTIASDRELAGVSATHYDIRAARASLPESRLPLPEGTEIRQIVANDVTAYRVIAPGADVKRVIVYFHGGGFLVGGFHSHRPLAAWLSHKAGAAVLFAEYRLAPEHRFPAGVDDCFAVYRYALEHGPDGMEGEPESVFVGGDSAGGAMAVSTILKAREAGLRVPKGAIILCGMLDLDEETSRFLQLTQRSRDGVRMYVSQLKDLRNPLASPILADLSGFPPMLIQTGTADYCADENERFAEKAMSAGVEVDFENWPEMIHVWQRFAPKLPEAVEALERIGAWTRLIESRAENTAAA